jgi:hypothetical protein
LTLFFPATSAASAGRRDRIQLLLALAVVEDRLGGDLVDNVAAWEARALQYNNPNRDCAFGWAKPAACRLPPETFP